jgi:hypothetical protein
MVSNSDWTQCQLVKMALRTGLPLERLVAHLDLHGSRVSSGATSRQEEQGEFLLEELVRPALEAR